MPNDEDINKIIPKKDSNEKHLMAKEKATMEALQEQLKNLDKEYQHFMHNLIFGKMNQRGGIISV